MITLVGIGAVANQNYQTVATPALPDGVLPGDLLLCISLARSTANNGLSSSWAQLSADDTNNYFLLASYSFFAGSGPTITPANMTSGQTHASRVIALRGVNPASPFGPIGVANQQDGAANVGVIAAPVGQLPVDGAVIIVGARLGTWTDAAVLTGTLTYAEGWDENTSITNVFAWVMDYSIWSGAAPALTSKTFTITGGVASSVIGKMFTLNGATTPTPAMRDMAMSSMAFPPFPL